MALSIKIGGVERAQDTSLRSLSVASALTSQVDTADFQIISGPKPLEGQEVIIESDGTREFGGQIVTPGQAELLPGETRYSVRCVDWTRQGDKRLVNESYTDQTRGSIARDIVTKYCTSFTAILANVPDGPVIRGTWKAKDKRPSECFRELCEATGGDWYWDANKGLHLFDTEEATAPFRLADDGAADAEHPSDLTWTPDITDLATRLYLRGGWYFAAALYSQDIKCDGTAKEWGMAYKPKDLVATLDGAPQVVAVDDLINQPVGADLTYNFQEKLLKLAPGKAVPTAGQVLHLTYYPFFPVRVRLDDTDAQTRLAALEGGDGIYEATIVDESIDSVARARLVGEAFLRERSNPLVTGGYSTLRTGLRVGQTQTVQLASRGIDTQILIGGVTRTWLPNGRVLSTVTLASRLQGGVEDLLVRLLRDRNKIQERDDEVLEIVQAFKSMARASDTMTVAVVAPESRADYAKADRSEVA